MEVQIVIMNHNHVIGFDKSCTIQPQNNLDPQNYILAIYH